MFHAVYVKLTLLIRFQSPVHHILTMFSTIHYILMNENEINSMERKIEKWKDKFIESGMDNKKHFLSLTFTTKT